MTIPDQNDDTNSSSDSNSSSNSNSGPAPSNGQTAFNYYVSQGLTPAQASGIVGNLQGESGKDLNPAAVNPGDGRDGSDSIGIAQWNGSRAQALKDYATSKGVPWTDLPTQLEFLHNELKGPEAAAYKGLMAAQTPEQAGQAMLAYERPKDWNKAGAHPERAQYAARAFAAYGDSSQAAAPGAASDPAAPISLAPPASSPPIFAKTPAAASDATGSFMLPIRDIPDPTLQAPQGAPIFAGAPRPQIDLSKLRAALASRAPLFAGRS